MAETVTMPKLGFDMAEGTLVRWVIPEGQPVTKGAVLAEIETDKATVEVESTYEGVLLQHLVKETDVVPVGQPIAVVGAPGEKVEAPPPAAQAAQGGEKKEVDKAGEVTPEIKPKEGQDMPAAAPKEGVEPLPGGGPASPLARRIAQEQGIDLQQVHGTGPGGRITKKDVESFIQSGKQAAPQAAPLAAPQPSPAPAPAAAPAEAPSAASTLPTLPAFAPAGPAPADQELPLSRLRAAIGRRMVEVKQQVPHFYVTHEYNMRPLLDLRAQVNRMLVEEEKIPIDALVAKAVAITLRGFPGLNASLKGDKIIQHGQVNVGIAVSLDEGLMTVVLRDADRKPVRQLGIELKTLVRRAREGKVRPDDVEGSTISISNLGMYDVEHFIAIINPPEAAILALGSAREVPVVEDGQVKVGLRMKATISVDHRVTDGATAARFMQALAINLEEPVRLLV